MRKMVSGPGVFEPYRPREKKQECPHRMCFKGTHESFKKGLWLCADCGEFVDLKYLEDYGVVMAALKKEKDV